MAWAMVRTRATRTARTTTPTASTTVTSVTRPVNSAEGQPRVELQRQPERPPHVDHAVKVVLDQRRRDPVGHHDEKGQRERQHPQPGIPAPGQRRDSPPLLQATQSLA